MGNHEEPVRLSPEQMAKVQEAIESKRRGEPSYTAEQVLEHIQNSRKARQLERGARLSMAVSRDMTSKISPRGRARTTEMTRQIAT